MKQLNNKLGLYKMIVRKSQHQIKNYRVTMPSHIYSLKQHPLFCRYWIEWHNFLSLADELDLGPLPSMENIQDMVERVLFATPYQKIKFT